MGTDPNTPDRALGREVERTARRLDRLEQLLRVLSQDITALREAIKPAEPDEPAVRAWLLAEDTAQPREDLADLLDWLAQVYLHYPDAALVSCWLWHPAVVEELWWLRQAHHDAYHGPHASYTRAGDWHDRQRPGVAKRIRAWLRDCDLSRHTQGLPARVVPLVGSADRVAAAWTQRREPPPPTPEEITEADQHDRHEHRTNHR
jgi:hypothetical protein